MRKKGTACFLALCLFVFCSACRGETPVSSTPLSEPASASTASLIASDNFDSQLAEAERVYTLLVQEDYDAVCGLFDPTLSAQVTPSVLGDAWRKQAGAQGDFIQILESDAAQRDSGVVVELLAAHETGQVLLTCSFQEDLLLNGLYVSGTPNQAASSPAVDTPSNDAAETTVTLFPGTSHPLTAIITDGGAGSTCAVVLVPGSGPTDADETVGANKPLRDIAHGLAARSITSIRFEKITFAHPDQCTQDTFQIDDEYTDTVLEALRVLQQECNPEQIFLLGHSQGGMLTPYLMQQAQGVFEGGIILAGSPRSLWEIQYDQNLALIEALPKEEYDMNFAALEQEAATARGLSALDEAALKETMVFGLPAYYMKSINDIDTLAIAHENQLPLLILQGEADFQVSKTQDFAAWQTGLADMGSLVTFQSYEGLNHLFMPEEKTIAQLDEAYQTPLQVDPGVIDDIVQWLQQ